MFMNQISSLKKLTYYSKRSYVSCIGNIFFTHFPGARDCLTDLSELRAVQILITSRLKYLCHNLQSLTIDCESQVSNELKELVSSQNNLKNLKLTGNRMNDWTDIIPALMKHSNTLTTLLLSVGYINYLAPCSFISSFLNLQEIIFSFIQTQFEDFKKLQYFIFPKLHILKIL